MSSRGRSNIAAPALLSRAGQHLSPGDMQSYERAIFDGDLASLGRLLDGRPLTAANLLQLVNHLTAVEKQSRQRAAANSRHATRKAAREWACRHCEKNRHRFDSKIEYATAASALVQTKFGISVKPTTIARDWLDPGILFGKLVQVVTPLGTFWVKDKAAD